MMMGVAFAVEPVAPANHSQRLTQQGTNSGNRFALNHACGDFHARANYDDRSAGLGREHLTDRGARLAAPSHWPMQLSLPSAFLDNSAHTNTDSKGPWSPSRIGQSCAIRRFSPLKWKVTWRH